MGKTPNHSEDSEIHELLNALCSDNGMERQRAREALVAKGKDVIGFLMELLAHPKHIYRWEAVKALDEIGHPASMPLFIQALEDDNCDVRWIAAKGLIKHGMLSVGPLLKSLIEKSDSVFVLAGAHHVFFDLNENGILPQDFPVDKLLSALKKLARVESVKPLAYELLNNL